MRWREWQLKHLITRQRHPSVLGMSLHVSESARLFCIFWRKKGNNNGLGKWMKHLILKKVYLGLSPRPFFDFRWFEPKIVLTINRFILFLFSILKTRWTWSLFTYSDVMCWARCCVNVHSLCAGVNIYLHLVFLMSVSVVSVQEYVLSQPQRSL